MLMRHRKASHKLMRPIPHPEPALPLGIQRCRRGVIGERHLHKPVAPISNQSARRGSSSLFDRDPTLVVRPQRNPERWTGQRGVQGCEPGVDPNDLPQLFPADLMQPEREKSSPYLGAVYSGRLARARRRL